MSDGARVTIRELAAAMGRRPEQVEAEAAELGRLVKPDRAGHPVEGRSRGIAEAARAVQARAGTRRSGSVSQAARDAAVEAGRQNEKHQ